MESSREIVRAFCFCVSSVVLFRAGIPPSSPSPSPILLGRTDGFCGNDIDMIVRLLRAKRSFLVYKNGGRQDLFAKCLSETRKYLRSRFGAGSRPPSLSHHFCVSKKKIALLSHLQDATWPPRSGESCTHSSSGIPSVTMCPFTTAAPSLFLECAFFLFSAAIPFVSCQPRFLIFLANNNNKKKTSGQRLRLQHRHK